MEEADDVVNRLKRKREGGDGEEQMSTNLREYYEVIKPRHTGVVSQLLHWLKANEYEVFSSSSTLTRAQKQNMKQCPSARITSFMGGKYHFPAEKCLEFLEHLAHDAETEDAPPMFWNQIAFEDEGARLIVDIDSDDTVMTDTLIEKLSTTLWKTLKDYYSDFDQSPIDIFVAKCGPRIKKGKSSTGLHLVAHVRVSFVQANQLIYGYKLRLECDPSLDMTGLTVDAGVYKTESKQVSLRMIFSRKIEDCPICKGPKHDSCVACSFCEGKGRVSTKKTYEPLCCVNPKTGSSDDIYFKQKCGTYLQFIQCYSIWAEPQDSLHLYSKPIGDPVYATIKPVNPHPRQRLRKIRASNPAYKLIEAFIRNIIWDKQKLWENVTVQNISLTESEKVAYIYLTGLNSSQCPYVMKDHGGNRIFFVLNRSGLLTVHCNSEKVEYGCKTKTKISFQVSSDIVNEVFGTNFSGNVLHFSGKSRKDVSGLEFITSQRREKLTREQLAEEKAKSEREKELKRLKEVYGLEKTEF
jgi:hypothetical protein